MRRLHFPSLEGEKSESHGGRGADLKELRKISEMRCLRFPSLEDLPEGAREPAPRNGLGFAKTRGMAEGRSFSPDQLRLKAFFDWRYTAEREEMRKDRFWRMVDRDNLWPSTQRHVYDQALDREAAYVDLWDDFPKLNIEKATWRPPSELAGKDVGSETLYFDGREVIHFTSAGTVNDRYDASSGRIGPPPYAHKEVAFREYVGPLPPGVYYIDPAEVELMKGWE
ncbi:MAG: hypothetical protein AB1896_17750, partial [Thermodesulfobacteriota bacterium]